jgi:MFS transporter, DHA1 family, multidrug resistance protein
MGDMDLEKGEALATPPETPTAGDGVLKDIEYNAVRDKGTRLFRGSMSKALESNASDSRNGNGHDSRALGPEGAQLDDDTSNDFEKNDDMNDKEIRPAKSKEYDPNLITWDGPDDPENPQNWSATKKWATTALCSGLTLSITFSSSVFSTATEVTALEFGVSDEVMILGTALTVLGFCFGPLIWGPFSELYGRKPPLFFGMIVFAIFQIPVAVATNLETIFLSRFFVGFFGCAPLVIMAGALADYFDPVDRGVAICLFAAATFIGPVAGPIVGGFVTESYLGWRWTAWLTLIIAGFFTLIGLLFVSESFAPVLLQQRARKIRLQTRNWAIHSELDEHEVTLRQILVKYLFRPIVMLVREPILVLLTIYISLVYGILYLFFEAYPIAFQEVRGWSGGVGALPFIGIIVGVIIGAAIVSYATRTRFNRKLQKHGKVIPEERLPPMMLGGVLLPIGLFWFAWTADPNISWVPQVLAGIPIGAGVLMIFMQGLSYIVDVYLMYANSAIAANTLIRSATGAGFPLFAVCKSMSRVAWGGLSVQEILLTTVQTCTIVWGWLGLRAC